MAYIEVNQQVLRNTALALSAYCSAQNRQMGIADTDIKTMLASEWLGYDAQEFGHKWESVSDNDSTTIKFRESLLNFGINLCICADIYQNAQADTYNEANRLPKELYW